MLSKEKILIVEDSFIVAYHLQTTLESEGYHVIGTQASGEDALEFIERQRPDLVLMDIMLAGQLDGIETARIIKTKYSLPVIYITALTDKKTIQRAKVTEPYGYLTKPFEDREIFTVIEMALYKHNIESKLKESEEKYFSTVRSISDAVLVLDQHYQITYLNPSAEIITGWHLGEAQGKTITEVLFLKNPLTDEFGINPVQCVIGTGRVNSMPDNLLLITRQGVERPIGEGSMSPIIGEKGGFLGLVLIFKDISERIEHERVVKDFEMRRLAALLEGQENERSRIAKDMHDGLGQMLNAIKMKANIIMRDEDLYNMIDDAISEARRISDNLVPSKINDFDLSTCLNSLCNQIDNTASELITFESFGVPQNLDHSQKINFYRIAQEAINNSLKHARASSVTIQLYEEEDKVRLLIEDDGIGIEYKPSMFSQHGLSNMRERAEIMGGQLTIESDASRGTLIIAEAPITFKVLSNAKV
jgi:PAS domain S-box-containing protein